MFELSIKTRFSAAHHLVGYPGSCASLHGHNWEVEVVVHGKRLDKTGILMDFRELKAAVNQIIKEIDHSDLNAVAALKGVNPTSENIAKFLFGRISKAVNGPRSRVARVSVNETPDSRAVYWR
jgi:6-pyruvoyltetrahydropterin/6-carboxytetrahydropterin synthase